MQDKSLEDKLQVFLDFFIFSLQTSKSEKSILKLFPIQSNEFLILFLLRFKLYLKYEGKVLILSPYHFKILQVILLSCVQRFSRFDLVSEESILIFGLIMSVGSKVFIKEEFLLKSLVPVVFSFEFISKSLLFSLRDSTIFSAPNFWQAYFDMKYNKSNQSGLSSKLRVLKVAEVMMYFHYFFSCDFEVTSQFVDNCLASYNTNLRLLKNPVKFKVGETLYNLINFYNAKLSTKRLILSYREKVTKVISMILSKQFLVKKEAKAVVYLDRYISNSLLKSIIKSILYQKHLGNELRKQYWLKFVKLNEISELKTAESPQRHISQEMLDQIQIDVARTRQWRGQAYMDKIQGIIIKFFSMRPQNFEYFQGFNFIVSFFFEIFQNEDELMLILGYISRSMLSVP